MGKSDLVPQKQKLSLLGRIIRPIRFIPLDISINIKRKVVVYITKEIRKGFDKYCDSENQSHECSITPTRTSASKRCATVDMSDAINHSYLFDLPQGMERKTTIRGRYIRFEHNESGGRVRSSITK